MAEQINTPSGSILLARTGAGRWSVSLEKSDMDPFLGSIELEDGPTYMATPTGRAAATPCASLDQAVQLIARESL